MFFILTLVAFIATLFLFYWGLITLATKLGLFKNKFLFGLFWGLVSILAYLVFFWLNTISVEKSLFGVGFIGFKHSTVALVAICTNLIPTFFADRRKMDEFVRGIMIPTVLFAMGWFIYFNPLGL